MSWFTNFTGNLGQGAQNIGAGAGGLINGILPGLTTGANNLLGNSSTTVKETTAPDEAAKSSTKTLTIVIVVLAVLTIGIVGFILLKKSKTA